MVKISKFRKVRDIPSLKKPNVGFRKSYEIGKMGKNSFKRKKYRSEDVLEMVHTDLCGPNGIESYS